MDGHSLPFRIRLSGVCLAKWVPTAPASQPHPPHALYPAAVEQPGEDL